MPVLCSLTPLTARLPRGTTAQVIFRAGCTPLPAHKRSLPREGESPGDAVMIFYRYCSPAESKLPGQKNQNLVRNTTVSGHVRTCLDMSGHVRL